MQCGARKFLCGILTKDVWPFFLIFCSISSLSYEFAQERRAERGAISACRLDDVAYGDNTTKPRGIEFNVRFKLEPKYAVELSLDVWNGEEWRN